MPSVTATIANGQSLSAAVDLGHLIGLSKTGNYDPTLMALITPAGWATNDITFQVSVDGVTYVNLYRVAADGTPSEVKIAGAVASLCYTLSPADWKGFQYLKIRSGTAGSPAAQAGGDVLTLVVSDL